MPSIAAYVERGEALSLPIYMGEGGESGLAWLQTAFGLYEDLGISWNFWPWKKLATWNSPVSVDPPDGWADVVDHAAGCGPRPPMAEAQRIFDDLLGRIRHDSCEPRPEVVRALFHRAPTTLAAESFGFKGEGVSHRVAQAQPLDWFRVDDRVTVRSIDGREADTIFGPVDSAVAASSFEVVIGKGDWVEYSVETTERARLEIAIDTGGGPSRAPVVELDGVVLASSGEGDHVRWVSSGALVPGHHDLRLVGVQPDTIIRSLRVELLNV